MKHRRPASRKSPRRVAARSPRPSRETVRKIAADLFAARGLNGVRMDEIARAARSSPSQLSRLFKSKDALFLAVVEAEGSALVKTVAGAWSVQDPPEEKLRSCLTALASAFGQSQELRCQILLRGWAEAASRKPVRLTMAWFREQLRLCLQEILQEGVETGVFRGSLDPAAFSAIALGAAEGLLLQSSIQGGTVPVEGLVETLQRVVLR